MGLELIKIGFCRGDAMILMDVWILEEYISSIILSVIGTAAAPTVYHDRTSFYYGTTFDTATLLILIP